MGRPALRFAVSLLFALVCVGLLAACSNDEATTTATPQLTAAEATAPPVRVLPTTRPAPPLPTNPPRPAADGSSQSANDVLGSVR
jgi:hypothetical protein